MLDRRRIAERMRVLREQRGLTQDELARRTGLSVSTISNIERAVSLPDLGTLENLRAGLEMALWELSCTLTGSDERPDPKRRVLEETLLSASRALPLEDLGLAAAQTSTLARHRGTWQPAAQAARPHKHQHRRTTSGKAAQGSNG
jgi:transcriptional regulator with XRE-family HTH domain